MAIKSIVEIDVKDDSFKKFHELFADYTTKLGLTPGQWGEANVAIAAVGAAFAAQTEVLARLAQRQRNYTQEVSRSALQWKDIGQQSRHVYDNIVATTTAILRWTGAGAIFSGLLGAGGLFGLDKLAGAATGTQRRAQALGGTYGEQRAFGNTYGQYFTGTDSLIEGVNQALTDPSKFYALLGAGASQKDIQSGDALKVAASILPNIQALVKSTSLQFLEPALQSRGLGDVIPLDLARQLRSAPDGQLGDLQRQFGERSGRFDVGKETTDKWADFLSKLDDAGNSVEKVLVDGLAPLAVSLGGLATALATDVAAVLKNPAFGQWIDEVGVSLGHAATYLGSPEFVQQLKDFTESFGFIVDKVKSWAEALGFVAGNAGTISAGAVAGGVLAGPAGAVVGAAAGGALGAANAAVKANMASDLANYGYTVDPASGAIIQGGGRNNPGNIRAKAGGFASYDSPEEGVSAIGRLLQKYEDAHGLDTISGIIGRYAPGNENDTASYIRDVVGKTGLGANQHLDLHDEGTLAKLVSAITRHEGTKQQYTPSQVVTILDRTGGNVTIQTSQAAPPQ